MQARLVSSREIAPDVRHFVFEAHQSISYMPGQFISITEEIHGRPITRAYSLAGAPSGDSRFELCLNRVEGGHISPFLFSLQPGNGIEVSAPLGAFVMREPMRDSLLIATGTGVAPFRAYLQQYLPLGSPRFTLLLGARFDTHILYRDELEAMAQTYPQFRFWPTLTRPAEGWTGHTGRVQTHLDAALDGRRDIDVYLCGMKEMVDQVRGMLKEMGFDRKQIRSEKYD